MPKWMNGWKTYVSGVALIVLGVSQYVNGDQAQGTQSIIMGIAIMSGRQAIANVGKPAE